MSKFLTNLLAVVLNMACAFVLTSIIILALPILSPDKYSLSLLALISAIFIAIVWTNADKKFEKVFNDNKDVRGEMFKLMEKLDAANNLIAELKKYALMEFILGIEKSLDADVNRAERHYVESIRQTENPENGFPSLILQDFRERQIKLEYELGKIKFKLSYFRSLLEKNELSCKKG